MLNSFLGVKILLTGHTGFKGSWLTCLLNTLGAKVSGYSLPPPTTPNLFEQLQLKNKIDHHEGDIRDEKKLLTVMQKVKPDAVIHLAAQPLVITSYNSPVETFSTNVQGTAHVLDTALQVESAKALLMITTDKVYENNESLNGYSEEDRLGGHDPYSASKAMAELLIASYRSSFAIKKKVAIASARSGNVIGGGDFSPNRLLPDIARHLANNNPITLRSPNSSRPWMHVLEPLFGYLHLLQQMLKEPHHYSEAWNFAPKESSSITCQELTEEAIYLWGKGSWIDQSDPLAPKETKLLKLSGDKTYHRLGWRARYDWKEALKLTLDWYKAYYQAERKDLFSLTMNQIHHYQENMHEVSATSP